MKTTEDLIKSAEQLNRISGETVDAYSEKQKQIIARTNDLMLKHKKIQSLTGENDESKMIINHTNHVGFMESIMRNFNPEVFINTILWVYRTYSKHGFDPGYWQVALEKYDEAVKDILEEDAYAEISEYYNWMRKNHRDFVALSCVD